GETRFNMLVLGMDRRPGARDNLNARTDVIMIVSYDPLTQRIGILHIPRDMHLAVINVQDDLLRINTLLVEGESLAEGYGPYFAIETLQLNFGMYIDAYVAFDFEAFIGFIDAIGGVTIDVPYEIYDPTYPDMNYGVDPFYIARGIQHIDGETALKYSRTRHGDNDYLRGERQLQVVTGVFDQLSDPTTLREVIVSVPELLDAFDGHVYTNIATDELIPLGVAMMQVDHENVVVGSLNQDYSFNYTYRGQTVRVPDREMLPQLLTNVFGEDYWR
ncbi:MAG: LCP family protein, partial [Anaerolineae bacterium]|nr:LCP family protein [Anaerolineae bacterium]